MLVTKGTRDEGYKWSAFHKEKRMHRTLRGLKKNFNGNGTAERKEQNLNKFFDDEENIKIFADDREKVGTVLSLGPVKNRRICSTLYRVVRGGHPPIVVNQSMKSGDFFPVTVELGHCESYWT